MRPGIPFARRVVAATSALAVGVWSRFGDGVAEGDTWLVGADEYVVRVLAGADTGGGPACLAGVCADLVAVTVTTGLGALPAGWGLGFTSVVAIPRTLSPNAYILHD